MFRVGSRYLLFLVSLAIARRIGGGSGFIVLGDG